MTLTAPRVETLPQVPESPAGKDESLRAAATARLRASGYRLLGNLRCEVRGGVISVSGEVPTFYLKQVAQTAVAQVDGVQELVNLIDVVPSLREANRD